jgi:N-carbamoylputrescine amidase
MKASLVVHRVTASIEDNLGLILNSIDDASGRGSDLVMFSETALTGLVNDDVPEHDVVLGAALCGEHVAMVRQRAKANNINVALGIFEVEDNRLFDTALFVDRDGRIGLKYRRISAGWHDPHADPEFYGHGTVVEAYQSDIGMVCFLICGDLFDDELVDRVQRQRPDLLLVPFARAFEGGGHSQGKWEKEELAQYLSRVQRAGVRTLLTNYLDDDYFGGAFNVEANGRLVNSLPLGAFRAVVFRAVVVGWTRR